jgi:rRNA maturation endonuclease Nob1
MNRREAREQIARLEAARTDASQRRDLIETYWTISENNPEWNQLSIELRNEMSNSDDPPKNTDDARYDQLMTAALIDETLGATNEWLVERLRALGVEGVEVEGAPEPMLQCHCCGRLSITSYEWHICTVCYWENTPGFDLDGYSGPNHMTLREGRKNFIEVGSSDGRVDCHLAPATKYPRGTEGS